MLLKIAFGSEIEFSNSIKIFNDLANPYDVEK
jgi:hypothetical protein